jgi:hypothetical protein
LPSSTERLLEPLLAIARSSFPSPLKSPVVTDRATSPTLKFVAALKLPDPSPNRTETLSEKALAVARSRFPSPLKSPVVKEAGLSPTARFVAGPKLGVEQPPLCACTC